MANKLELTWYGKDEPLKIEPRLLIENTALSNTASDPDTENMIIHGDNLLALKALESKYAGKVKCIYIDPPYNTGNAFEHYDDSLEHSIWLSLMRPRLAILRKLLAIEGLIFIQIDDNEYAYLKVLCDEVFGRNNYLNTLVIKAKAGAGASGGGEDKRLKKNYEFILVYVKDYDSVTYNIPLEKVPLIDYIQEHKDNKVGFYYTRVITNYGEKIFLGTTKLGNGEDMKIYEHVGFEFSSVSKLSKELGNTQEEIYNRYIDDIFMVTNAQTSLLTRVNDFVKEKNKLISYEYVPSTGKMKGKLETKLVWNETLVVWLKDSSIIEDGKVYKTEKTGTLWTNISWGRLDLEGGVSFKSGKKPETLIQKIFEMTTEHGDLVMDSFLGSGTTVAVAHKMGRNYIGVEMGEHAYTHCKVRLDKVIAGEDAGGITKSVDWTGVGGYRFYELAPSLINIDPFGEAVINTDYDANMLAAGVALHEGFTYQPDTALFWKQAKGNEDSYLFVTTRHLSCAYLDSIKDTMEDGEYLVIACRSFDRGLDKAYSSITVKKIPQMLLDRCEFGKADYNLNIVHPPVYEDEEVDCDE